MGNHLEHLIELREPEHPQRRVVGRSDQHQATAGRLRIAASANQRGESCAVDKCHSDQIDDHSDGTGAEDFCEPLPQGRRFDGIEPTEQNDGRGNPVVTGDVDTQAADSAAPGRFLAARFDAVDAYLTKPVNTRALRACVDAVLANRSINS